MPLQIPNTVLIRLVWNLSGSPYAVNVLAATKIGAVVIDQTFANQLGVALKSAFTTSSLDSQISNLVSLATVGVRDINQPNLPEYTHTLTPAPGLATGKLLPPQAAVVATLRTAKAGKSYRGRVYLCGFADIANSTTGTVESTAHDAITDWMNRLSTAFTQNNLTWAVASRKLQESNPVTAVQLRNTQWETIRGRATPGI